MSEPGSVLHGTMFQARIFLREALKLLDPASGVVRVGQESGPKGFDDVWVEYDPARAPKDQFGDALWRDHIQCKWHESHGDYGFAQLADPAFVNANAVSLLQRAHAAQMTARTAHGAGTRVRFTLLSNWQVAKTDPLYAMIHTTNGSLRLEGAKGLFHGKTAKSASGNTAWRAIVCACRAS